MRVLVTGSSGRIGQAVVHRLAREHRVTGLDQVPGPDTQVIANVCDGDLLDQLCSQVDAVVHTAALHAPHVGQASEDEFRRTNVDGTRKLVDACVRAGHSRLVLTSTTSVYGDAMVDPDRAVWVDESLPPKPRDIYDQTKLAAEDLCREAGNHGLSCISLRMSRCFPEPEHLVALYRLYRGVDQRDVAEAHSLALNAELEGFHVFNVSARSPFRQADLEQLSRQPAQVIERCSPGAVCEFQTRRWPLPERIDRVYAIDRAAEQLGYQPRFNFEWFMAQPWAA
ncbi:MAG: NAD(P)-dependent oxidoreductase [Xanthomonadales bacterium]|nr:NAD(P)-dependent oxidoreductase [Xanthomonadales bacterium]